MMTEQPAYDPIASHLAFIAKLEEQYAASPHPTRAKRLETARTALRIAMAESKWSTACELCGRIISDWRHMRPSKLEAPKYVCMACTPKKQP
jgi:hypothetical protein